MMPRRDSSTAVGTPLVIPLSTGVPATAASVSCCRVTMPWALILLSVLGSGPLSSLFSSVLLRSVSPICSSFPSRPRVSFQRSDAARATPYLAA